MSTPEKPMLDADSFVLHVFIVLFAVLVVMLNGAWLYQTLAGGDFPQSLQNLVFGLDGLVLAAAGAVLGVSRLAK